MIVSSSNSQTGCDEPEHAIDCCRVFAAIRLRAMTPRHPEDNKMSIGGVASLSDAAAVAANSHSHSL
jgi:hypothetical protein